MSNEWTAERIAYVRNSQPSQREWHEALAEIERLQAENAALLARVSAEVGEVLVPRKLVEGVVIMLRASEWHSTAKPLQACLDAPQPRVVQKGDVVIPASVAEKASGNYLWFNDQGAAIHCVNSCVEWDKPADFYSGFDYFDSNQAAIDALAREIGGTKPKPPSTVDWASSGGIDDLTSEQCERMIAAAHG
jgi:hypothetical protein